MEAVWIWRQFPRQIASDLRSRGLHIKHWLRGTLAPDGEMILSSYELLEVLEFLPEESAFKTDAERGGRWPEWKRMLAEAVNQGYRMHASYLTAHGVEDVSDTSAYEFVDPVDLAEKRRREELQAAANQQSQIRFEQELGFSA